MSAPAQEPDDGFSKGGPLNYAPKKARHAEPEPNPAGAMLKEDAAPKSGAAEPAEPPWRRSRQHAAFVGDVAAVELRNRLALAPDRLPEPPPSHSTGRKSISAGRLAAVVVVAAVGVVGYRLGSAPPGPPSQLAPRSSQSGQSGLAPERSGAAAYLNGPSLDSKSPSRQPAAGDLSTSMAPSSARGVSSGAMAVDAAPSASLPEVNAAAPQSLEQKSRDADSSRPVPRRFTTGEITLMVKNGTELMANGSVGAARMMFQPAAEAGDAAAAFALAETYDPLVLRRLNARGGITADAGLAQVWYQKAKDLGSAAAGERLDRLARLPE